MLLASIARADLDGPPNFKSKADNGGLALARPEYGKGMVAVGAGEFGNRPFNILYGVKAFFIAAIELAQVDVPQFVEDLCLELDGIFRVQLYTGIHQGFSAVRAFYANLDSASHDISPFTQTGGPGCLLTWC
jgi:hypothetical protein